MSFFETPAIEVSRSLETAYTNRPEMQALRAQAQALELDKQAARAERLDVSAAEENLGANEAPAAGFPLMAKRNGARLVIINREPTEFDDMADLVARHDIGAVLESFIVP